MDFYITKRQLDESEIIVKKINGSKDDAYNAFSEIIKQQAYEYHVAKSISYWPVIRLYDANGNCIGQES